MSYYHQYQRPSDVSLAKMHRAATKLKIDQNRNDQSCQCCAEIIDGIDYPLCSDIEQIADISMPVYQYFNTLKVCVSLLLIHFIIVDVVKITISTRSGGCVEVHSFDAKQVCEDSIFNTYSMSNLYEFHASIYDHSIQENKILFILLLQIVSLLAGILFLLTMSGMHYYKFYYQKVSKQLIQRCSLEFTHVDSKVTVEDIQQMLMKGGIQPYEVLDIIKLYDSTIYQQVEQLEQVFQYQLSLSLAETSQNQQHISSIIEQLQTLNHYKCKLRENKETLFTQKILVVFDSQSAIDTIIRYQDTIQNQQCYVEQQITTNILKDAPKCEVFTLGILLVWTYVSIFASMLPGYVLYYVTINYASEQFKDGTNAGTITILFSAVFLVDSVIQLLLYCFSAVNLRLLKITQIDDFFEEFNTILRQLALPIIIIIVQYKLKLTLWQPAGFNQQLFLYTLYQATVVVIPRLIIIIVEILHKQDINVQFLNQRQCNQLFEYKLFQIPLSSTKILFIIAMVFDVVQPLLTLAFVTIMLLQYWFDKYYLIRYCKDVRQEYEQNDYFYLLVLLPGYGLQIVSSAFFYQTDKYVALLIILKISVIMCIIFKKFIVNKLDQNQAHRIPLIQYLQYNNNMIVNPITRMDGLIYKHTRLQQTIKDGDDKVLLQIEKCQTQIEFLRQTLNQYDGEQYQDAIIPLVVL